MTSPKRILKAMTEPVYRFGKFELCSGKLRVNGTHVRMQEKPLLLLTTLLENPGQIVTREQLRQRMWPNGTFVDYEQGINVAIKKLRDALGDSADKPVYIETIAKKGYRFLLKVETAPTGKSSEAEYEERAFGPISSQFSTPRIERSPSRWLVAVGIAVVAVAITAGLMFLLHERKGTRDIKSIAVLPLRNLSADADQEYLADGITEEIITDLAQSLPLRVISRTSIMRYKQTSDPISRIARELGVEAIVEGSVARSGDRVAITVQLIDARDDRHLWAYKYERKLGDLLAMEGELSQQIASQVGGTLSLHNLKAEGASHAIDPQVYEFCLLGRYYANKRTAAGLAKSEQYFQQAIAHDPNYAPAYAGLASTDVLRASYDSVRLEDQYAKATEAARKALELDDSVAEAHATLGLIALNNSPDWMRVEPEFRRALELNPNYATAHHWFAYYQLFAGRRAEALEEMEVARQLDPLSVIINADEGFFLYGARRYDEARIRLRRAIELGPDFVQPRVTLALIDFETGNISEAVQEAQAGLATDSNSPRTIAEAGYVLAVCGQRSQAKKLLTVLQEMVQKGAAAPSWLALLQMGLGQRNEALDTIQKAVQPEGGPTLEGLVQYHAFDELKTDPNFQVILARTGRAP